MSTEFRTRDDGRFDELAEEFAERYRRGGRPSLQEYFDRLPEMADEIREMFPALIEVEVVVIKGDNGPALRAEASKDLLADWNVFPLISPPYRASYNGVCERANLTMKLTTAHIAERAGQDHSWRSEDLESACQKANQVSRGWGASGQSPQQRLAARNQPSLDERQNMWQEIETARAISCGERDRPPGVALA
jgi:hypothetical protein